jgi:hypothetical protein
VRDVVGGASEVPVHPHPRPIISTGKGPGLVPSVPEHPSGQVKLPANTELPSDENRFVSASYVGLLEIDRLVDRQEASLLLLINSNTAFGRAARHLHTILELNFPSGNLPGGQISTRFKSFRIFSYDCPPPRDSSSIVHSRVLH